MIDFRMYTFLAVCKTMNYTKAAEELNITQPAVSQHIRYIEEYYHTKLFAYEGKKMRFTKAGEMLKQATMAMVHDETFLMEKMEQLETKKKQLNFGVTLTVGDYVIGDSLKKYLKKHRDTKVQMYVENTHELMKKIWDGTIDFAIVEGHLAKSEFACETFSKESYIAVCGPKYTFQKEVKRVEDLLSETIMIREPGSGTREILQRSLESRNLSLADFASQVEIGNINVIKQMVEENLGISFLYEAAVRKELAEGSIKKIPLEDFNLIHDFTFVWMKGSIFTEDYMEILQEMKLVSGK